MSRPEHTVDEAAWARFVDARSTGDVVRAQVVAVRPFGAFVRVAEGVDGFAPATAMTGAPSVGSTIEVRITAIDEQLRRFSVAAA